jgi:hypothetical protein
VGILHRGISKERVTKTRCVNSWVLWKSVRTGRRQFASRPFVGSLRSNSRRSFGKYPARSFERTWRSLSECDLHAPAGSGQGAHRAHCECARRGPVAETGGSAVGTYNICPLGILQKYPPIRAQRARGVIAWVKGGYFLKGAYWVMVGVNYMYVTKETEPCLPGSEWAN